MSLSYSQIDLIQFPRLNFDAIFNELTPPETVIATMKLLTTTCCSLTRLLLPWALVIFSLLSQTTSAYMITIDTDAENECFHEKVPIGTKLGFSFEVVEGGFYDIDVVIKDPSNVILHQDGHSSNGKFTIETILDGPYQFCFSNRRSSRTPKVVLFDIDRSDLIKLDGTTGEADQETKKLTTMIENLLMATITTRHDVRYLAFRDKVHKKINEATNSTIIWWSGIEFILLLSVTLGQVWYLRRFFEIRRKA